MTYDKEDYAFAAGSVFHRAAIPSVLLNEDTTLFRRKYYINGSNAGMIAYLSEASQPVKLFDHAITL
ncbi:hypothetical protein [Yersinia mollaretii]|uniref:hypothetical protein n=1 Tax=Yersinia mollaretii TaxID=33060 RepID=UPI0025AEA8DE|nr:hypothetical protein [Yersinia mollaretii]